MKSICVFCGSKTGSDPDKVKLAAKTGKALAVSGYRLIYGGGGLGLMGAVAQAAFENDGEVLGILPQYLKEAEASLSHIPHKIVPDMRARKKAMFEASNAFIVLPGGIGTLEEAIEILSWRQLGLHKKPICFISPDHYWAPLAALLDHTVTHGFSGQALSQHMHVATTPAQAISLLEKEWKKGKNYQPPKILKI